MKIKLKSMLLLIGVSFIIFTGCKKEDSLVPPSDPSSSSNAAVAVSDPSTSNRPAEVFLTTTTTGTIAPGVKIGTFIASAELGTSGTYEMHIETFGQAFHCTTTFTPVGGSSFTTFSECEMTLLRGQWRIIGSTGAYANLQANGSIVMMPGHEYCTGRVF